ncbi:MAG: S41 family peptidase [Chloroflexi bacterium]|nr:S41 family peptidase [Chloroflexota bacterium]
MNRARVRVMTVALVVAIAFGAGVGVGTRLGPAPVAGTAASSERYAGFGLFWEAWDLVKEHFVQPERADPTAMTHGAIAGMLDSLGDTGHTRFLDPEERRRWDEQLSGNFVGIGVQISVRDGRPVVVAPIPGSPAEAAGIKAGDIILAIDGVDTLGLTLDKLSTAMRGPAGSQVELTVRQPDADAPRTVRVERREIDVPSVAWTMLPGSPVALVRLSQFADGAHDELTAALGAARAAGARGLVLDLRDNPGGLLHEAVDVAGEFLTGGTIVQVQQRDGSRTIEKDPDSAAGAATDLPLAVLINEGSASSAEIVAGALKENGRAPLIGERTFGTGTVLSTYPLSDGSAVLLGTALWLTPDGHAIKEGGITPTHIVSLPAGAAPLLPAEAGALSAEALRASEDRQLLRALDDVTGRLG